MSIAKSVSKPAKGIKAESRKAWWKHYRDSLKYSLHVITHPFDGFWDLIHEQRGTMAAAHTFLFLFLLTRVLKLMLTSFQFISAPVQHLNIFEEAAIKAIASSSNGSVRKLNSLIKNCLLICSNTNENVITANIVMLAENTLNLV